MARLGLPPLLPGELQGLLGDGLSLSTTSKVNRDGAWEKVITVDNDLKSRIERQAGNKLNPTTAAAILSELAGTVSDTL
jgi:hypothetical protein